MLPSYIKSASFSGLRRVGDGAIFLGDLRTGEVGWSSIERLLTSLESLN